MITDFVKLALKTRGIVADMLKTGRKVFKYLGSDI